jgi:predicted lipid-binding transport protein (Tim44 family)
MILSGLMASETVSMAADTDKAMAGLGAGISGGLMTGGAGFIGFFLGSILLLVGLVLSLGGHREVIVITPAQ